MEDSIFTKIIKGEIPAHKIYEDDKVIAFLDIHPINPGHTLVVPKQQTDHLWDMREEEYSYVLSIGKKLALHIREILQVPRVGLVVEGYGVPHAHLHLIPLLHPEDIKKQQDMQADPDHEALAMVAGKLRTA